MEVFGEDALLAVVIETVPSSNFPTPPGRKADKNPAPTLPSHKTLPCFT